MIRYLARIVARLFQAEHTVVPDFCPWCFDPMSEHVGGVECDNGADTEAPEATGKHPTIRKAKGVYPPSRSWDPYPEHPEGD